MEVYLNELKPFYVPALQAAAHDLAQPALCYGIPVAYFAATVGGYGLMRFVDFYKVGEKVSAVKGGKKPSPGKITKVLADGTFEVTFGGKEVEVLAKKDVSPVGFAPPDWFKSVYNLAQVSLSVYCAFFGAPVIFSFLSHPFGVNLPMEASAEVNTALHYCICVHFLSKFLDYVDTILILIGKKDKQLSVLHVYHHCSISMVWGYLIHTGFAFGTVCFGAWINAVVHSVMYTYYGLTAASVNGKRVFNTKPFKPYVTSVQLTQFCMCITHALVVLALEQNIPSRLAWLQFGYHCTMIALFGQFFYRTYYVDAKKEKRGTKGSKVDAKAMVDCASPPRASGASPAVRRSARRN